MIFLRLNKYDFFRTKHELDNFTETKNIFNLKYYFQNNK